MPRVYATAADYETYTGETPPADIDRLLQAASLMLDTRVLAYCRYDVDDQGAPSDSDVAAAVGRAVCAQVFWWGEVGDSTGAAGAGWASVSIGSVNLGGKATAANGADSAARQIAPQVADELRSPDLHDKLYVGAVAVPW